MSRRGKTTRKLVIEKVDPGSQYSKSVSRHLSKSSMFRQNKGPKNGPSTPENNAETPILVEEITPTTSKEYGNNNNGPDLREKLSRNATKRFLEDPDADARDIIDAKRAKTYEQRAICDLSTVQTMDLQNDDDIEIVELPDTPDNIVPNDNWNELEYIYAPETLKRRICNQAIGRKEFLNQKIKTHTNLVCNLTISREMIRAFPAHSESIQTYYKQLRDFSEFLSNSLAMIDELSANIFNGNLEDKESVRRAQEGQKRRKF